MVNFTRKNLLSRIILDYNEAAYFANPEFKDMAVTTFFILLGKEEKDVDATLSRQVRNVCKDFVDELRKKWRGPKVNQHLDRLEQYHSQWLKTNFKIPYLDEIPKISAAQEEPQASQNPIFQPEPTECKPPSPKRQKTSFLDKVSTHP